MTAIVRRIPSRRFWEWNKPAACASNGSMRLWALYTLVCLLAAGQTTKSAAPPPAWLTWGGANRDFITATQGLAEKWPAAGPKRLWMRTLGDGYSGIAVEDGRVYTGYRRGAEDVITALNAATGQSIWEVHYQAPFTNQWQDGVGPGPYAMPQIVGGRVVAVSGTGIVSSIDKKTSNVIWRRDLYKDFEGTRMDFGYSCHALPYKDTLIYMVGGSGAAAVALRQSDGQVVWKAGKFKNSHSSPLLINVDGQEQVVAVGGEEVVGFSPTDGARLWSHPHKTEYNLAVATPVWGPGNLLFVSSAYGTGGRVLELRQAGGKTAVKQLWADPKLQVHFGNTLLRDGHLYFVSGYNGPGFVTAVEMKTGAVKWQERGFAKGQLLWADGKAVLLDQEGTLALLRTTPQKLEILGRTAVAESFAWTPPTLAGTRLYLRDRKTLAAYELGK